MIKAVTAHQRGGGADRLREPPGGLLVRFRFTTLGSHLFSFWFSGLMSPVLMTLTSPAAMSFASPSGGGFVKVESGGGVSPGLHGASAEEARGDRSGP